MNAFVLACLLGASFVSADETKPPMITTGSNNRFWLQYQPKTKMVKFTAEVNENQYLSVGFGKSMTNTDMTIFQARSEGQVLDLWSNSRSTPETDSQQDFTDIKVEKFQDRENGMQQTYRFYAYRQLSTGDAKDFEFVLGQDFPIIWAENNKSAELRYHSARSRAPAMVSLDYSCKINQLKENWQCVDKEQKSDVGLLDKSIPADKCLEFNYAAENYDTCCANGGYKLKDHKPVCSCAGASIKSRPNKGKMNEDCAQFMNKSTNMSEEKEQRWDLNGVGEVRMEGGETRVKIDGFGDVEMDGQREKMEIDIDGLGKIDMNGKENTARARIDGVGRVFLDGDKNRIEIVLGASKIAVTASVLAGLALF